MQAGAYQNGTWVVGVAKGGVEEGVDSLAQSCIVAPSGQIVAQALHDRRRADRRPTATSTGAGATPARCSTSTATAAPSSTAGSPPNAGWRGERARDEHDLADRERRGRGGAGGPPAPARRAPRGARRHVAEGRLLAVGPVRLLHRPRRRQGGRVVPAAARPRSPGGRRHPGRRRPRRAAPLRRRLRRLRRPAVRVLHPRHRRAGQGPDRQEGRRPHPRGHGPPPRRPPVPLHRLREGPRRHRGRRRRQGLVPSTRRAASAASGAKYEAAELALGDRGYVDDLRVPGLLHAALRLTDHARADVRRIDTTSARAAARRRRRVHRRRRPRRAAGRASSTRTGRC